MRMERRKFRIGELAKNVGVERFVIRFWEKEFSIKPERSEGKQRFYDNKECDKFKQIKNLLYDQKFTIEGAKMEILRNGNTKGIIPSQRTTMDEELSPEISKKLLDLKSQLLKLKRVL
jgi:DNA-binding transcriptional MerR regulator